jgi:hypothetical protein
MEKEGGMDLMEPMVPPEGEASVSEHLEDGSWFDTTRIHISELFEQVPRLAVAAAIFFATTPVPTPDTWGGGHNS